MCNSTGPCIGVEKMYMKILFLFLLVAGPFCVWGQWLRPAPGGLQGPRDGWSLPGFMVGDSAWQRRLIVTGRVGVRVMHPDRMPCVVGDLAFVERMPVDLRGSADRMPVDRRRSTDQVLGGVNDLLAPRR